MLCLSAVNLDAGGSGQKMFFWQVAPDIHIHKLHSMGPAEDDEAADGVPTFLEWELPAKCAPYTNRAAMNSFRP